MKNILKELVRTATKVHRISDRETLPWIELAATLKEAQKVLAEPGSQLFTMSLDGNLHQAATLINAKYPEIIDGIVSITCAHGHYYTIVVYRAQRKVSDATWEPEHDPSNPNCNCMECH